MELVYTGKTIDEVGVVPLPEGWPAADHNEPDTAVAGEKVASGNYRYAQPPPTVAGDGETAVISDGRARKAREE